LINAKLSMLLAASVMAVATAACSGPENTASQAMPAETPMAGPNETAVVDTAAVDSGTTDFVEKAVNSNMFEIEASKIALERSKVSP
jgi:predicted outer membrane protein